MDIKGTTIVGIKRNGKIVIAGDGQVTIFPLRFIPTMVVPFISIITP